MPLHFGPGPVFVHESIAVTRRWQLYALRSGFVLSLLGGLAYLSGRFTRVPKLTEEDAEHGSVDHYSDQGRTRQLGKAA